MNYILKKVEVNGNADRFGGSDDETEISISSDIEKLKEYCRTNFNSESSMGKPETFGWVYFKIVPTEMIII